MMIGVSSRHQQSAVSD